MMEKIENDKNNHIIFSIENAIPRLPEFVFSEPVNWTIQEDEQWAIIGPNGAGKTCLTELLQGKYVLQSGTLNIRKHDTVKSIAFKDIYSLADYRNAYYQQRWHSTETDGMPLVSELLEGVEDKEYLSEMVSFFGIHNLLEKRIIFLSSGELRKFLIVRALLSKPRILILDNPFIGLDVASRKVLNDLLQQITLLKKVQVVLLLSNPADIPEMITHVLPIIDKTLLPVQTRNEFLSDQPLIHRLFPLDDNIKEIDLPVDKARIASTHEITLRMEKVSISYGERTILKDIDWTVKNGEKWALLGPNGSGKSTLLSLVYADNPQAYANTIYLFDRKRGTGESIWDIKKRIGYVSPEMHLFYNRNVPVIQIVGSGLFDSIGLYRKCNTAQEELAESWMKVFDIDHLKDRLFLTLSSGEQRLVLLARAFVKDPDLLILDEPLHGLDISRKKRVARIIEQFCNWPGKSLIYVTHYPHELPALVDRKFELKKI